MLGSCFFFSETFWSFSAEIFWPLKHFSHLSHSCIKTRHKSVLANILKRSDRNDFKFFRSFQKLFGLLPKND